MSQYVVSKSKDTSYLKAIHNLKTNHYGKENQRSWNREAYRRSEDLRQQKGAILHYGDIKTENPQALFKTKCDFGHLSTLCSTSPACRIQTAKIGKIIENQTKKHKNYGNHKKNTKKQVRLWRHFPKEDPQTRFIHHQDQETENRTQEMKTLKISVFLVALVLLSGCSAHKRAERHIRKAVELCPSLVQVKAHPIDTVLTVPGFADCVKLPLSELLAEDTLYAATDHGTVMAHLDLKDRVVSKSKDTSYLKAIHNVGLLLKFHPLLFQRAKIQVI